VTHGTCGACGSGITVQDGLVVGRDDADLLAALEDIAALSTWEPLPAPGPGYETIEHIARAAIAKARGES
jgi:hypothetical protein